CRQSLGTRTQLLPIISPGPCRPTSPGGPGGRGEKCRWFAERTTTLKAEALGLAGLAKCHHAVDADFLHGGTRWLHVVARVEFFGRLCQNFADRAGQCQTVIGIDVDFPDTVFDSSLDLLDRDSPGRLNLAAILIDNVLQVLRDGRATVHD